MSDKVYGGTPKGTRSLCLTCRHAAVIRGINLQQQVFCRKLTDWTTVQITFPVEQCSMYDDKRTPALYDMEDIAWHVTSRNRGPVGFGDEGATEIHVEPPEQGRSNQPRPPETK